MFKSKWLVVAALTASAVLAGTASTVHGQVPPPFQTPPTPQVPSTTDPFSDAIAFVGTANITGSGPGVVGEPLPCTGAVVCLVGGSGTFNFTSLACAGVSSSVDNGGVGIVDPSEVGLCAIGVTGGTFQNVVCGTGEAQGTATLTAEGATNNDPFTIDFVASVGLAWGNDAGDPYYGVVVIGPFPGVPPAPPGCQAGFTVVGALVAYDVTGAP